MPNLLEQVTKYLKEKEKGQYVPDGIRKLISSRNWSDMTSIELERLFDRRQPYLDWNCTGSQSPISYLLLLLLWMKIHGPFQKDGFNTWIVDGNTRIELPNDYLSCQVAIISCGQRKWSQPFNSGSMVASINTHMMMPEELAEQEKLRNQAQALNYALKKADDLQTCSGYRHTRDGCQFCKHDAIWEQVSNGGPGT